MPSGNQSGVSSRTNILLAGLESGVAGGLAMLAWLAAVSLWNGRSVWSIPNLLATTFYGEAALRRGFRWMTLSGLSFHLFLTGLFGMNFSEHPELGPRWIYQVLSLMLIGSLPVMLYFFRRYKWL